MKKSLKILLLLAAFMSHPVCCEAADGGEVLWWLIDDYQNIVGKTAQGDTMTAADLKVNRARIRYEDKSGVGYLTLFGLDESDDFVQYNGNNGVGLPAEYFGSLYGLSSASCTFVLELGNWENGQWVGTSMESNPESYSSLVASKHIASWAELDSPYSAPWTPTEFRVVPEPNTGLMLLLGGAILALRRRRNIG